VVTKQYRARQASVYFIASQQLALRGCWMLWRSILVW